MPNIIQTSDPVATLFINSTLYILMPAILTAITILAMSSAKARKRFFEERGRNPNMHGWVDDPSSPGAKVVASLVVLVGVALFLAVNHFVSF